jgi:hypothetical protein
MRPPGLTEQEIRPRAAGERYLSRLGWDGGKHVDR